jgi:L-fuculose-phosphate aldolase
LAEEWPLRHDLVEVAQRCEAYGLVLRSQGNFSARIADSDRILITPTGIPYSTMRPGDIVEVGLDGRGLKAPHPPSYELPVHLAAYRADPRIKACAHTEPPHINALYALNKSLPNVLGNFIYAFAGRGLAVGPRMKSGTPAFATANIEALGDRFGIVWPNHGLFCVGRTLEVAFIRSLHAEQAAQVYYLAIALNEREPLLLPNEEQRQYVQAAQADGWDAP